MKLSKSLFKSMQKMTRLVQAAGTRQATTAIQRALRGQAKASTVGYKTAMEAMRKLNQKAASAPLCMFTVTPDTTVKKAPPAKTPTDPGEFRAHTYVGDGGIREYKLYVPSNPTDEPLPLIVMLHGCTQNADDFAVGTQMNALAERKRCLVAYPVQRKGDNVSRCWNWFRPEDQRRDQGEPAIIAGITREITRQHAVDPRRIYVAGLSAGGAMAVIMAANYPDLYAAVGVHSGLDLGSAHDVVTALSAMRSGTPGRKHKAAEPAAAIPLILFQGDADTTVNPKNAEQIIARFTEASAKFDSESAAVPKGHTYTRKTFLNGQGKVDAEQWTIHGSGHAWSGGHAAGSYTDGKGPQASREMLRFFLQHPKAA